MASFSLADFEEERDSLARARLEALLSIRASAMPWERQSVATAGEGMLESLELEDVVCTEYNWSHDHWRGRITEGEDGIYRLRASCHIILLQSDHCK